MTNNYTATIMGSVIAIICFATTWTYFIPILTMLPIGLPLELVFGRIFENTGYASTAIGVFLTLTALFILHGLWLLNQIRKDKKDGHELNNIRLFSFFAVQLLIIHPLVFYAWVSMNPQNAGDGQFMLGIVKTFPLSSVLFAVVGFTIDQIRNRNTITDKIQKTSVG